MSSLTTVVNEGPVLLLFLLFYATKLLNIYSMFFGQTLQDRRLVELLATTEFLYDTSLFEFTLELLESSFDVLAFLYRYYNHVDFV